MGEGRARKKGKKKKSRRGEADWRVPPPHRSPPPSPLRLKLRLTLPQTTKGQGGAPATTAPVPPTTTVDPAFWSQVVGRQEKKAGTRVPGAPNPAKRGEVILPRSRSKPGPGGPYNPPPTAKIREAKAPTGRGGEGRKIKLPLPKPPRSAAVTISSASGGAAEFITEARKKISLAKIGIKGPIKVRKAMTGALILEVRGADAPLKANRLAARLREVAEERDDSTRIQRPNKIAAIKIRDVEDSLSKEEIAAAVASVGGCTPSEITVGNFSDAQQWWCGVRSPPPSNRRQRGVSSLAGYDPGLRYSQRGPYSATSASRKSTLGANAGALKIGAPAAIAAGTPDIAQRDVIGSLAARSVKRRVAPSNTR